MGGKAAKSAPYHLRIVTKIVNGCINHLCNERSLRNEWAVKACRWYEDSRKALGADLFSKEEPFTQDTEVYEEWMKRGRAKVYQIRHSEKIAQVETDADGKMIPLKEVELKLGADDDDETSGGENGDDAMVPRRVRDPLEYERGEIRRLQKKDEEFGDFIIMHEVYRELTDGGSPPDENYLTANFKASLKRLGHSPTTAGSRKRAQKALQHFAKYELREGGLLYRVNYDPGKQEEVARLCIPGGGTSAFWYNGRRYRLSLRRRLLLLTHDSCMGGGHPSIQETWLKIKEHGWWPTLYEDCVRWVNGCAVCKLAKPQRVLGTDAHMELYDRPFRVLMVDGVGPINPPSPEGYTWLLHAEGPFSRFCWVRPTKANDGETVAKFLVEEVFLDVCGFPTVLRTDRGPEYTATIVKEICDYFKVRQVFGSSYHPQSQGYIEARHKVINQVLRCYVEKYPQSWAKWARAAQWCMRSTPRADRAGRSPYEIVTGLRPQGPISRLFEQHRGVKLTVARYVGALHDALENMHQHIREGLTIEYDRKIQERERERERESWRTVAGYTSEGYLLPSKRRGAAKQKGGGHVLPVTAERLHYVA